MSDPASHEIVTGMVLSNELKDVTSEIDDDKFNGKDVFVGEDLGIELSNAHDLSKLDINTHVAKINEVPNMWSKNFIGLYCQYAAVGLLYGSAGTLFPFCAYHFKGAANVCSNSKNIVNFAWNIKVLFAILTDCYRPFGMRRKPWMIAGWIGVLIILLMLTIFVQFMDVSTWLVMLMLVQGFLMLSDVPADGYSVELGQLEPFESRGQILATGQRVRFTFCIIAGAIQTFLLNGPSTNADDCHINFSNCWSWGLNLNEYYGLLFCVVLGLTIPIFWLKEIDVSHLPQHSFSHFLSEIWDTLQNLTTFYLLIYVIGTIGLTNFTSNVNTFIQYYVIKLTNFEAGIDTISTYTSLVLAIYVFQTYLINRNWRYTSYASTFFSATLGLIWIAAYYNAGGTLDPWFTIFIDLDTYFASGLSQVLYSMAVIELAKPGQEATTYELVVTVGNAALLLNGVISTQLLTPLNANGCTTDDDDINTCPTDQVNINNKEQYQDSNGPYRFTLYCVTLVSISLFACLAFTPFLPSGKLECASWRRVGEEKGESKPRGYLTLTMCVVVTLYGFIGAILLLNTSTSCLAVVGGTGC